MKGDMMLHIVQVVLHGGAETPQIFIEEAAAHAAFVACAKRYWAQSYAAYCERAGVDAELFSSAQAFVATFDVADRSRIHHWSVTPEGAGLPGAAVLKERREQILRLADEVAQASEIVRDGVAEILETFADLTGEAAVRSSSPVVGKDEPHRLAAAEQPDAPVAPEAPQAGGKPQPSAGQFDTKEWRDYVETIKNMCGGNRSEFHLFNRDAWRQAVYSGDTSFEYWQWVAVTIDEHIEKAQQAGYTVVPDPDHPGRYRFQTPQGELSDVSSEAQGDAWCRAGLHLEGK